MEEVKALKLRRGFAAMSPERRREIATLGGRAVQAKGVGHSWTSGEATVAGRKGGQAWSEKNLLLKHFTKESTSTMIAFFAPLLMAPQQASHFLAAVSICKNLTVKAPAPVVDDGNGTTKRNPMV